MTNTQANGIQKMTSETRDPALVKTPRAYQADYFGWLEDQLVLLKTGRLDEVDAEHVAEEIRDIASREFDKLEEALTALTFHILRWDLLPDRRSGSTVLSIDAHRDQIDATLRRNPSLMNDVGEALVNSYTVATYDVMRDSGLAESIFAAQSPYDFETLRRRVFRFDNFVSPSGSEHT